MAKEIRIILEEDEYNKLIDFKKGNNWRSLLTYHIKKNREDIIRDKFNDFVKDIQQHTNEKENYLINGFRAVFINFIYKRFDKERLINLSNEILNEIINDEYIAINKDKELEY